LCRGWWRCRFHAGRWWRRWQWQLRRWHGRKQLCGILNFWMIILFMIMILLFKAFDRFHLFLVVVPQFWNKFNFSSFVSAIYYLICLFGRT
jgi:hypothetical protein